MHCYMIHEKKIAKSLQKRLTAGLRKLKSKCWIKNRGSNRRRQRVVAGIKIVSTSHVENEPPFYLETTEELHCKVDYKGTCILTVHGFISATRRF